MGSGPSDGRDIVEHLTAEHRQVEQMWADLRAAHEAGTASQQDLGREIVRALSQHDALELQLLYPALGRAGHEAMADGAKEDHAEIRRLLDEVDGMDPVAESVFATFAEILADVERHVQEEERVMFPLLRSRLASDELIDLDPRSEPAEGPALTSDGRVGVTVAGAAAGRVDHAGDVPRGQ